MKIYASKIYFIPVVLFGLLLVYAFSDVMTSRQAGFRDANRSTVYLFLGIIISVLGGYNAIRGKHSSIKWSSLSSLLIAMSFWILFVDGVSQSNFWFSLIHVSVSIWWIFSYHFFYNYQKYNVQSTGVLLMLFLLMFGFYVWANFFIRKQISVTYDTENVVTGYAYLLIMFVPYMALLKQNWLKVLLWIITVLLTITSYKRGPMVILPVMLMVYYFSVAKLKCQWIEFIGKILLFGSLIIVAYIWIDTVSGGFLSYRFSDEQLEYGSGRNIIWTKAINSVFERDLVDLLIGTGSGSSVKYLGTGAHNEWIEFLFSFGFVGVVLYLIMCVVLVRKYLKALKNRSQFAPQLGMMVVYVLLVGLFSGMYFQHSTFYIFSFFGLVEFLMHLEKFQSRANLATE